MNTLCFIICLIFSVSMLVALILLAIFPLNLPLAEKTTKQPQVLGRHQKARDPTHHVPTHSYWAPPWEDDDEDL